MKKLFAYLDYLAALFIANMRPYKADKKRLAILATFMMLQNSLFFSLWIVLFDTFGNIKGWALQDMARMFGLLAGAIGIALSFFNGVRQISYKIQDSSIDALIARPRSVLPALLLSGSSTANFGDLLFAPILWFTLGNVGLSDMPFMLLLLVLVTSLFMSMLIIIYSIGFWFKGDSRFPDQLFMTLIIGSQTVVHGQAFWVKLALMTLIPAWFTNYIPTMLMRAFDPVLFAWLCGAVVLYGALAIMIFNAGLRRYVRSAA